MLGIFMLGIFMAAFLELGNNPSMIFLQSSTKHAPMTQLCLDKRCRMDNTVTMKDMNMQRTSATALHWFEHALAINRYLEPQQSHLPPSHGLSFPDFGTGRDLTDDTLEVTTTGRLQGLNASVNRFVIPVSTAPPNQVCSGRVRVVSHVLESASGRSRPSTADLGDFRLLRSLEVCPGRKWKTFRRRSSTHRRRRHRWLMLAGYIHVTSVFLWWFVVLKLEFFGAVLQYSTRILIDQQITVHRMARAGAAGIQHIMASSFRQRLERLTSGSGYEYQSLPGPNSRGSSRQRVRRSCMFFWIFVWLSQFHVARAAVDTRVASLARGEAGAGSHIQEHSQGSPAKHRAWRGEQTRPMDATSSTRTLARKRALRRARNRALSSPMQGTLYKGKWHTAKQLGACKQETREPAQPRSGRSVQTSVNSGQRLWVYSHNVGGLTGAAYDEWMTFAHGPSVTAKFHIMVLQETGWTEYREYDTQDWHVVHSGASNNRYAGVMIMLNRRTFYADSIHTRVLVAGRLLHVRVGLRCAVDRHVDIIGIYQHAWNHSVPRAEMLARRDSVWTALARAVAGLSARNQMYVAGDFNATLRSSGSLVGPGVVQSATPAADAETLQHILESWQLIALNTWGPKSSAATFANDAARTQIDFILTRYSGADSRARTCKIDRNTTLFRWRSGGRHFPLVSSLPAIRFLPGRRVQNQSGCDLESLRTAVKRSTPAAQHLKQEVSRALQRLPGHDMQKLNDLLFRLVCHHFPARPTNPLPRPWHEQPLQGSIRHMWELHRQAVHWARASHRGRFLGATIRAWKFYAKFQRMHKEVKKRGRQRRKELFMELVAGIQTAADRGDQRGLYSAVKKIAPKTTKVRMGFRDDKGAMMSADAEMQTLKKYCESVFGVGESILTDAVAEEPVQVAASLLWGALRKMKTGKATPVGMAPVGVWKLCAEDLIPKLEDYIQNHFGHTVSIPTLWTDAHMVWLDKGKPITGPADLRPIGLQDAGGRIVARALNQILAPYVHSALQTLPQFAYTAGRRIESPLARVAAHCSTVHALLETQRLTLHDKRRGAVALACCGGCMLALDLSKAFDTVCRSRMMQSLRMCGVPENLVILLVQWHNQVTYKLSWKGLQEAVHCRRGVRQGCPMSPTLFSSLTVLILNFIGDKEHLTWLREYVSMFADDVLGSWVIYSEDDLRKAMSQVGRLLYAFARFGLEVNRAKSVVVISLRGRRGKQWLRQHTQFVKGEPMLIVRAATDSSEAILIPQKSQITYLGIIATYDNFRWKTVQHRLSVSELQRNRLLRILHARRNLSTSQRLKLWKATVWASMTYGTPALGLDDKSAELLVRKALKHIRAITHDQVHITGTSHMELLTQWGLQHPLVELHERSEALLHYAQVSEDPMVHNEQALTWFTGISSDLQKRARAAITKVDVGFPVPEGATLPLQGTVPGEVISSRHGSYVAAFTCEHCLLSFGTLSVLKRHVQEQHGMTIPLRALPFDRACHSKLGMPQCKHCDVKFNSWSHLERHIQENNCSVLWFREHEEITQPGIVGKCSVVGGGVCGRNDEPKLHFPTPQLEPPEGGVGNPGFVPNLHFPTPRLEPQGHSPRDGNDTQPQTAEQEDKPSPHAPEQTDDERSEVQTGVPILGPRSTELTLPRWTTAHLSCTFRRLWRRAFPRDGSLLSHIIDGYKL